MAKESRYSGIVLFLSGSLLLTGGWLMASFPIFIFFGLSPLFAMTDHADDTTAVWEKIEWVLLSLTIYFLAAHSFDFSFLVSSMIHAILFTLPFVSYVWVRQTLGNRVGKITILVLWLALEYALLKFRPVESIYLGDALRFQPEWVRWNVYTGYLGGSCWILAVNLLTYQAILSKNPFQWYWIILTTILLIGPGVYSYFIHLVPLTHADMVNLYSSDSSSASDVPYLSRGEFVVRTSAWLSILILLFTFVKSQTTK